MENSLENRLGMYQKVHGYYLNHQTDFDSIAPLTPLFDELRQRITNILNLASLADADPTGAAVDKQQAREAVQVALLKVGTALVAHAALTADATLLEQCDETSAAMQAMRDNDFYAYSQRVHSLATTHLASLADFGVTAPHLSNLSAANAAYLDMIQDPKLIRTDQAVSRNQMQAEFEQTDTLLSTQLDRVVRVFESSNFPLYDGYTIARRIDDTGAQTPPDYDGEVNPEARATIVSLPYQAARSFRFSNTGGVALSFYLSANPDATEGTPVVLQPGGRATRSTPNLNNNTGATYLCVHNATLEAPGRFEVRIDE